MQPTFGTSYKEVLGRLDSIAPIDYCNTRNYIDGAVTYLSPYISRGVISTRQVLQNVLSRGYKMYEIEPFVKELAWRDNFQRIWQQKDINRDIKNSQQKVNNNGIATAIVQANTGIVGLDNSINNLYDTGYMHNHCRMYTASVACNIGQSYWLHPAQWMYYYLLDGDWGSNACSWQWVAGTNSTKKYFVNQENISKYTKTPMQDSFLAVGYEQLESLEIPTALTVTEICILKTRLPASDKLIVHESFPTLIYNYYNLDPLWHTGEAANRILLSEPAIFEQYPVSEKCIDFMLELTKNIPGIQIYTGSFQELQLAYSLKNIYYKEHPLNKHYQGTEEPRDWLCDNVTGYFPSFFAYWKKLQKEIQKQY